MIKTIGGGRARPSFRRFINLLCFESHSPAAAMQLRKLK